MDQRHHRLIGGRIVPIRPDVLRFLELMEQGGQPALDELEPNAARQLVSQLFGQLDLPAENLNRRERATLRCGVSEIEVQIYQPRQIQGATPAMVFFHGGAWIVGDLDSHDALCSEIAREADLPLIAVNYRLAPEHRWPSAADDCEAAARQIADHAEQLGLNINGIVLCGDSAGGGLAATTAIALRNRPARLPVVAQWLMYPVVDLSRAESAYDRERESQLVRRQMLTWIGEHYQPQADHWRASPLLADHKDLPPLVMQTATLDIFRDQGFEYCASCAAAGIPTVFLEAAGSIHGMLGLRKVLPSASTDLVSGVAALKGLLKKHPW